jgi:ATP-binding cassette subfamily B protein
MSSSRIPKKESSLKEYKALFPYLSRYRWRYLGGLVFLVAVDAAQIIIPQLIRRAMDIITEGAFAIRSLVFIALWMIAVMAVISLGRFFWRYFIYGSSQRIEAEMREKLFDHLLSLSYDFYQKNKIGDLMARTIHDLGAVRMAIGMGLVALVDFVIMASAILIIIFIQDARSAFFAVLPLPVITVLILLFGNAVGSRFQRAQESYSRMSDTVQETFAGIRVVKSFVKEWWFIRKFADNNDDYRAANMELAKIEGFFFPLVSFLSGLTTVILFLVGGRRVIEGSMTPGGLVALFRYLQMLIWPLMGAGFMVNMIQRGAVGLHRVSEVLRTEPSIRSPEIPAAAPAMSAAPAIEIRDLSFAYPQSGEILKNINLSIPRGAWVGILGRTGSGKSTLIKSMTRMIDPPAGTVRVFGIDVREWDLKQLRGLFAVTPQDSYLFSDSIKNNIGYGLEDPSETAFTEMALKEAALKEAADISALERDLEAFGSGWDTTIGERGLTLSGGQKQRTAISRAVILKREILILDDSLSAVDADTEKRILSRLLEERKGKTTIIISHRVSSLRHAGMVVVLEKGGIAESGSPGELAAAGGFYARTAALQQMEARDG